MAAQLSPPPIIVIGAHRSGTSILNRILGQLGVFTGVARDPNDEAWFFLRLNEWLLRQCGGRWDHPEALRDLLAHPELRELCTTYLRQAVDSPRSVRFLGLGGYLRWRGVSGIDRPWGFKDPRTTFTLPLWLGVFPTAKVIHIHRNGVDVAASLRTRQRKQLEQSRRLFARNRLALRFGAKRNGFTDSPRCASLEGAYEVWEEYVLEARRQIRQLEQNGCGDRALELSFEELATSAVETIERVVEFCELSPSREQIEAAAGRLKRGRASAHLEDPELRAFAERVRERELEARLGETADAAQV